VYGELIVKPQWEAYSVLGSDFANGTLPVCCKLAMPVWCKKSNEPYDIVIRQYYR
jgi:hypothetical protein